MSFPGAESPQHPPRPSRQKGGVATIHTLACCKYLTHNRMGYSRHHGGAPVVHRLDKFKRLPRLLCFRGYKGVTADRSQISLADRSQKVFNAIAEQDNT